MVSPALQWAQLIVLLATIIGAALTWWKAAKNSGEDRAQITESIHTLQAALDQTNTNVADIKMTLGNGGFSGIKQEIQTIKVQCAGDMSALREQVHNLEKKSR